MQRQDLGDDDSGVAHFLNSSPLSVGPERTALVSLNTRPLSGPLADSPPSSSSRYYRVTNRNTPWDGLIHSTGIGNYPMPSASAIAPGLQPRSLAGGGLDHHLSYFDSYHDRPSTFHTTAGSNSSDAYTYGLVSDFPSGTVVPVSLLLRTDTSSYIPTSQLGSGGFLQDHPPSSLHASGLSDPGYPSMASSRQHGSDDAFYSPNDLYGRESGAAPETTLRPSLSFTLPGIPSAEEAFLTHIHQSTAGIDTGISESEPLAPVDPRRDLLLLPSDYQQPLDFDNEHHQDIERNLYQTHIRSRSPSSSDSGRSSQKRAREETDALPSMGVEPSTWGVASPAVKRQRLDIDDGFASSPVKHRGPRAQAREFSNRGVSLESDEDGDGEDFFDSGNDDSDLYVPSHSPSPVLPTVFLTLPSPPASTADENITSAVKGKGGRKKAKGKAKGSAARALAMITKVREQQDLQERVDFGYTDWSGPSGGGASEGEGSSIGNRSTPTPAPVPVTNLTKKSRGRKVPYVAVLRGCEGIGEGFPVSGIVTMGPNGRRGRRRAAMTGNAGTSLDRESQVPTGEDRSFVCVVPGCGKCFVRAEHLKRHVRSIHTNDKPFLCPYKGCGKSFSRRDNLGQHVRIHLND